MGDKRGQVGKSSHVKVSGTKIAVHCNSIASNRSLQPCVYQLAGRRPGPSARRRFAGWRATPPHIARLLRKQLADSAAAEHAGAGKAGDAQPVRQAVVEVVAAQRPEVVVKGGALG